MLPSVSRLFVDANWLEREVWDMHGIYFVEHTIYVVFLRIMALKVPFT